jgi:hypothetical protein
VSKIVILCKANTVEEMKEGGERRDGGGRIL